MTQNRSRWSAFGRPPSAFGSLEFFVLAFILDSVFDVIQSGFFGRGEWSEGGQERARKPSLPGWRALKVSLFLLLVALVLLKPQAVLLFSCGTVLVLFIAIRLGLEFFILRQVRREVFRAIRIKKIQNADQLAEHLEEISNLARKNLNPIEDAFVGIVAGKIRDKHHWPTGAGGNTEEEE